MLTTTNQHLCLLKRELSGDDDNDNTNVDKNLKASQLS